MAINPNAPLPALLEPIFQDVLWDDWAALDPDKLRREDVDDGEIFKQVGSIPAGWIVSQLGLSDYRIGDAQITEEGNAVRNMGSATVDHLAQLVSYLKMQARDRIGLIMHDSIDYENALK